MHIEIYTQVKATLTYCYQLASPYFEKRTFVET